jgi:hypothetical protein
MGFQQANKTFKTDKGTVLPILNLRGKDYLQVAHRLVWFREEKPDWSIETEPVSLTDSSAYFKATIKDPTGRIIATARKFENAQGFADFLEKSETGAIGRALALIGYGTQFCADDLEEGERVVDSPLESKEPAAQKPASISTSANPGDFVVQFGRKFKGKKLSEIKVDEMKSYIEWLESSAIRQGTTLDHQSNLLKAAFQSYMAKAQS